MRHPVSYYVGLLKTLAANTRSAENIKPVAEIFVKYLTRENDAKSLKKILSKFLYTESQVRRLGNVQIETADPGSISEELKASIKKSLSQTFDNVFFSVKKNKNLGSGLRLVINKSLAVDASIRDLAAAMCRANDKKIKD